jgi:hypothetical protein
MREDKLAEPLFCKENLYQISERENDRGRMVESLMRLGR